MRLGRRHLPGDIKSVAKWLPVDTVTVITRLPEDARACGVFLHSVEQVVEEKAALIDALVPNGTLVLYADDERAAQFKNWRASGKKSYYVWV